MITQVGTVTEVLGKKDHDSRAVSESPAACNCSIRPLSHTRPCPACRQHRMPYETAAGPILPTHVVSASRATPNSVTHSKQSVVFFRFLRLDLVASFKLVEGFQAKIRSGNSTSTGY